MNDSSPDARVTCSPPSHASSSSSLKRKEPPGRSQEETPSTPLAHVLRHGANAPQGEYEAGRVICEVCGCGISFRDGNLGGFTLKHWDDHRLTCTAAPPNAHQSISSSQSNTVDFSGPPTKRRRAKRTEEERIEYLRADPYVAQFEAYRVLCSSCDKWIRLRPNSTYCSIPWDAHRKSCLAKKTTTKNMDAFEERNNIFSKDPDVSRFDSERILCNLCDTWLSITSDDHLSAVQIWLQHRSSCKRTVSGLNTPVGEKGASPGQPAHVKQEGDQPVSHASPSSAALTDPTGTGGSTTSKPPPSASNPCASTVNPPNFLLDLSPVNYAAPHESRRRNAEQRAATLRADVLIREVEPNRVFCTLCQKWVQLRQDSSYCAYPWLQHRGKCLARFQRRAQKAADTRNPKTGKYNHLALSAGPHQLHEASPPSGYPPGDSDGHDGTSRQMAAKQDKHSAPHHPYHSHPASVSRGQTHPPRNLNKSVSGHEQPIHEGGYCPPVHTHAGAGSYSDSRGAHTHPHRKWVEGEDVDMDADADGESDSSLMEESRVGGSKSAAAFQRLTPVSRALPVSLVDLDSPDGRKTFVFSSVSHLFGTTYEPSDDLPIADLLAYLNVAMPQDKHEDFDTSEVIRAAAALAHECQRGNWQGRGRFVFEGDLLRLVN